MAAPSGGEGEGEVGRSPRSGAALEGVFVSCFLGSSRKEILSHSAVLKCDELCSSPILHPPRSGGGLGGDGASRRAVGSLRQAVWGSRGRPHCFLLSGDPRAVGPLPQGLQVSGPGSGSGRGCGESWGGSSRQIYYGSARFRCLPFPGQWAGEGRAS